MRVRKGDQVEVVAGKDKGRQGKVLTALPDQRRVIVEGVNRVTRHTKVQQSQRGARSGGIVHQEAPIDVSNVMVVADDQPTRVGYRKNEDGRSVRFSRRTGKDI